MVKPYCRLVLSPPERVRKVRLAGQPDDTTLNVHVNPPAVATPACSNDPPGIVGHGQAAYGDARGPLETRSATAGKTLGACSSTGPARAGTRMEAVTCQYRSASHSRGAPANASVGTRDNVTMRRPGGAYSVCSRALHAARTPPDGVPRAFCDFPIDVRGWAPYTHFHRRGAAVHRLVGRGSGGLRDCW